MPIPVAPAAVAALLSAAAPQNPLLAPWTGPYGGVPPFDQVKVEHFKPALEAAMAEQLAEIDRITADPPRPPSRTPSPRWSAPAAPSTAWRRLRHLELDDEHARVPGGRARDGAEARRLPRPDHPERPALRAHRGRLRGAARRRAHARAAAPGLAPLHRTSCAPARKLDAPAKKRLSEINQRLATLYTELQPERARRRERLRARPRRARPTSPACPTSLRAAAAAAAEARGQKGKWAILNTRSSMEPFLTYSDRRDLREKVWRTFVSRGDNGDAHDNKHDHHRDPEAARRAREAARLPDPRPLAAREHDGEDARARAWS